MNKNYILFSFLGLSLLCSSCLKEPDAEQFVDISDVFRINLNQELGEIRRPIIELEIIEPENCSDVIINSSVIETSKDIILEINSISRPFDCNNESQFIRKDHVLHSNNGDYDFSITLASAEANIGTIEIKEDIVHMNFQSLKGIFVGNQDLTLIPDNFMWGYIKVPNPFTNLDILESRIFTNLPNLQINSPSATGIYGDFQIGENSDITFRDIDNPSISFYASYDNDVWNILKDNIQSVVNDPEYASVTINILNELGEVIGNE